MISIVKESRLAPGQVIDRAVSFFGPAGFGMEVAERAECCARFEGGGGHVSVQITRGQSVKGSTVTVQSVEWEHAAKEFVSKL